MTSTNAARAQATSASRLFVKLRIGKHRFAHWNRLLTGNVVVLKQLPPRAESDDWEGGFVCKDSPGCLLQERNFQRLPVGGEDLNLVSPMLAVVFPDELFLGC